MNESGAKIATAKANYVCEDCRKVIAVAMSYATLNEYGEKRRLHVPCLDKRKSLIALAATARRNGGFE